MKVFILEEKRNVHIRIYGIGGEQRTKEFFDAVFVNMPCIYPTADDEKSAYGTESLEPLQETLDKIAEAIIEGDAAEKYGFEYENYIV